uniref:SSD domain-containing protein n=1 Tax=Panagrolaimus sp. PS1159 TaxID=55785 RepID=A0AC35G665_9BILA
MLEDQEFGELSKMYDTISNDITFKGPNGTTQTFQNICEPFCGINEMLIKGLTTPTFLVDRYYPIFKIIVYDVNIGKFIFKRSQDEHGRLTGSKLMVFYYTTFVDSEEKKLQLDELDHKVVNLIKAHNDNPNNTIDIILHGTFPVQKEVERGFEETTPLILLGVILGFICFTITTALSAQLFRQLGCQTFLWSFCGILISIFSITASFGSICLIGLSINTVIAMTPFITISFILNAIVLYQINDIWHRLSSGLTKRTQHVINEAAEFGKNSGHLPLTHKNSFIYRVTKPERLAYVFEQIGGSFLTNFFVTTFGYFFTAYFAALPNYQIAMTFFAFIIFYNTILQLFFYCPVMIMTCQCAPTETLKKETAVKNRAHPECFSRKIKKTFTESFIVPYSKFLQTSLGKIIFVCIFLFAFLWPASYGLRKIKNEMDFKKILPQNSPSLVAFEFMEQHVWNDFLQFVFIVNKPPNFADENEYLPFREMVSEVEQIKEAYGPKSNMMWLIDYLNHEFDINYHKNFSMKSINMTKFIPFITQEPYSAWNDGLKYSVNNETGEITINKMLFIVTFKGITSLDGKVKVLSKCREILNRYPQYDVASFDTDSGTVDMILNLSENLIIPSAVIIVLAGIFSALIMQNIIASFATAFFTASSILGLYGFVYFINIDLDVFTVGTFLFTTLINSFLVSQAVAEYMRNRHETNRLQKTLERLCCQSIKLLILTFFFTSPVLITPVPVHFINISILIISILCAIVHIAFFIPSTMSFFSNSCTGNSCCYDTSD